MEPGKTFLVVKDEGGKRLVFVDYLNWKDHKTVILSDSLSDGAIYHSEAETKGVACDLNQQNKSGESWYVIEKE